MKKKLTLLYLYFGEWPWYFPYFLQSCAYNPEVNFKIITNSQYKGSIPRNVTFIELSFDSIRKKISKKLGFDISLETPYKLCDFKPAYGFLFNEYLDGADYWGHGDIDLIFGNIKEFIAPILSEGYDTISVRNDYPSGFFMLYKNEEYVNQLFKKSIDYKMIFQNPESFCFDECSYLHAALCYGVELSQLTASTESMHHVIKKEEARGKIKPFYDLFVLEGLPGRLKWKSGRLFYNNEYEILLYHFIQAKNNFFFKKPSWKDLPNEYYIEKNGFYTKPKNSLKGLVERRINNGKKITKKTSYTGLFFLNNIINRNSKKGFKETFKGKYKFGNLNLEVFERAHKLYLKSNFSNYEVRRIYPILSQKFKFVDEKLEFLIEFNGSKVIIMGKNGQIFHYKKASSEFNSHSVK